MKTNSLRERFKRYATYLRIWHDYGYMPNSVEPIETKRGIQYSISFKKGLCSYWCTPDPSGDFYHIGSQLPPAQGVAACL